MEVEIASRESSKHSNMDRLASSGHHHAHFSGQFIPTSRVCNCDVIFVASDNEEERDMSFERRNHSDEVSRDHDVISVVIATHF